MANRPATIFVVGVQRAPEIVNTLVVPAWNEATRLPGLLHSIHHYLDRLTTEVIVVDDGSTDGTAAIAEKGLSGFPSKVIGLPENMGKGAAVRAGVAQASGQYISFVDADNATDLSALEPMIERCTGTVAAVFGSRHVELAEVEGAPALRGVMGRVFNHVVRVASGTGVQDTQCGAKVFQAPVARAVFSNTLVDGFAFDVEILRRVLALGLEAVEHPVRWRHVAGTKVGVLAPARMLFDLARLRGQPRLPRLTSIDIDGAGAIEVEKVLAEAGLSIDPLYDEAEWGPDGLRLVLPDSIDASLVFAALAPARIGGVERQSRTWFQPSGRSES